jgi:hypothetical protein
MRKKTAVNAIACAATGIKVERKPERELDDEVLVPEPAFLVSVDD